MGVRALDQEYIQIEKKVSSEVVLIWEVSLCWVLEKWWLNKWIEKGSSSTGVKVSKAECLTKQEWGRRTPAASSGSKCEEA